VRPRETLRRASSYGRPYRRTAAYFVGVCLILSAASLLGPYFFGQAIDAIVASNLRYAYALLGLMLVALLAEATLNLARTYLSNILSTNIAWLVRDKLHTHILRLQAGVHDSVRHGDLLAQVDGDSEAVGSLILGGLELLPRLVCGTAIVVSLMKMSPILTAVQLAIFPMLYAASRLFRRPLYRAGMSNRRLIDEYFSFLSETIEGIREIKALNLEALRERLFRSISNRASASTIRLGLLSATSGALNMLISSMTLVSVIGIAGWLIASGRLTVGNLVTFMAYATNLTSITDQVSRYWRMRSEVLASLERVFGLLDTETEASALPAPRIPMARGMARGMIALKDVTFGYTPERPILEGVNLTFEPGLVTCLVGLSGSGKTTLISLLLRFYTPQQGSIFLDGQDTKTLDLSVLRRTIAVVRQEPFFFRGSIKENLLLAAPQATEQQMRSACEVACIADYIDSLPDGYDSPMGERGLNMSVGQRLRLAFARAILRDPRVLLCDEVSSALDRSSEIAVYEALRSAAVNRTVVLITHRPSIMAKADKVVVLRKGTVVDEGKHAVLLRRSAAYRALLATAAIERRSGEPGAEVAQ